MKIDWDYLISYPSVRFVRVRNKKLATFYYGLNLAIMLYVVVYSIILKKAYQESDTMVGTTALKLKGSASTGSGENLTIYDSIDLTIPPIEQGAVFITTNFVKTANQVRGYCEGNDVKTESCSKGCINGTYTWNGIKTGRCGSSGKFCEIMAWCPVEQENDTEPQILTEVKNWTVFSKIDASFPSFGVVFNNLRQGNTQGLVKGLNLFTISEILTSANTTFEAVAAKGAVVYANYHYRCDLDYSVHDCNPVIGFTKIDHSNFSSGFNFRYMVSNTDSNGVESRTLFKVMGVRVIWHVSGEAGRFNLVNLMIALGAGAALLGVSSLASDFIMQYCLEARNKYTARKYLPVNSKGDALPEYVDEIREDAQDRFDEEQKISSIRSGSQQIQVSETTPLLTS